jgi:hypothetical protein
MALNINPAATALQAAQKTTGLIRQTSQAATPVLIDLSPQPAQAKVVREGFQVPTVALNPAKASFFIDNLTLIDVKQEPRVVSQSVPAGTKVLPGQAVDLVLALTRDIPIDIFELPHRDLKNQRLNLLTDGILQDNAVRQTLLKYALPADVPTSEKTALVAQFAQQGITIDEGNADTGFAAAFSTVRSALAFR